MTAIKKWICRSRLLIAMCLLLCCRPGLAGEPRLRLATLEYPPYIINSGQGPSGLTVEIVRSVFARMNQPLEIEFFPISRGQSMLKDGLVDGFFSIKKNPEREINFLFPQQPLMRQDYVFFVRNNSPWHFRGHLPDLAQARIGVVNNTSYGQRFDQAAKDGVFSKLDRTSSHEMNFRKLLAGRIDAVICSRLVGAYYLAALGQTSQVSISGPVVETAVSYIAFSRKKNHQELSRRFDLTIEAMERDGSIDKLINAYQLPQARIPTIEKKHH